MYPGPAIPLKKDLHSYILSDKFPKSLKQPFCRKSLSNLFNKVSMFQCYWKKDRRVIANYFWIYTACFPSKCCSTNVQNVVRANYYRFLKMPLAKSISWPWELYKNIKAYPFARLIIMLGRWMPRQLFLNAVVFLDPISLFSVFILPKIYLMQMHDQVWFKLFRRTAVFWIYVIAATMCLLFSLLKKYQGKMYLGHLCI